MYFYKNETWYEVLQRGVADELNLSLNISENICRKSNVSPQCIDDELFFAGSFICFSKYKELSERKCDYVFVCIVDAIITDLSFDTSEISEAMWKTEDEIKKMINKDSDDFLLCFGKAFDLVEGYYEVFEN